MKLALTRYPQPGGICLQVGWLALSGGRIGRKDLAGLFEEAGGARNASAKDVGVRRAAGNDAAEARA